MIGTVRLTLLGVIVWLDPISVQSDADMSPLSWTVPLIVEFGNMGMCENEVVANTAPVSFLRWI